MKLTINSINPEQIWSYKLAHYTRMKFLVLVLSVDKHKEIISVLGQNGKIYHYGSGEFFTCYSRDREFQ